MRNYYLTLDTIYEIIDVIIKNRILRTGKDRIHTIMDITHFTLGHNVGVCFDGKLMKPRTNYRNYDDRSETYLHVDNIRIYITKSEDEMLDNCVVVVFDHSLFEFINLKESVWKDKLIIKDE